MRRAGVFLVVVALAGASLLPMGANAAPPSRKSHRSSGAETGPRRVPGEIVVRYRAGIVPSRRATLRAQAHTKLVQPLGVSRAELVETRGVTVSEALADYRNRPGVLYAEPNYLYHAAAAPDDVLFTSQWGLHNTGQTVASQPGTPDADIDAPEAWDATTGSRDVLVAVIDTGAALDHPDLVPNLWINPGESGDGKESNGIDDDGDGLVDNWRGWDYVDHDNAPHDVGGHGTHVTGTIGAAGNNGIGTTGVNWQVGLVPLRVLAGDGEGSSADVASAIIHARDIGARVVNLSLGSPEPSLLMSDAISSSPGVLVVAAAGNESTNNDLSPTFPCSAPLPNIVCVGASDANDGYASFSNWGTASVDLAAPGVRILSTTPEVGYGYMSGTSMATPHVAGATALLLSLVPDAATSDLRDALIAGVDVVTAIVGKTLSGGRLNVHRSLEVLFGGPLPQAEPIPTPEPTLTVEPTPTPEPTLTVEPTPLPTVTPPGEEEEAPDVKHKRRVGLRLRRGLVARGRVRTPDGFAACAARVKVKIFRNGRLIATVRTDSSGFYRKRLKPRPGRYVARAPRIRIGDHDICALARSPRRTR